MKELALNNELSSSKKSDKGQTNYDSWESRRHHMTTQSHMLCRAKMAQQTTLMVIRPACLHTFQKSGNYQRTSDVLLLVKLESNKMY